VARGGVCRTEFSKFTTFDGEKKLRNSVDDRNTGAEGNDIVVEAKAFAATGAEKETEAERIESRTGADGGNAKGNEGPVPPAALTLGGGIPGASPRALQKFCHSTAPGRKGGEAPKEGLELVKALK
jgi:hypothetical protein